MVSGWQAIWKLNNIEQNHKVVCLLKLKTNNPSIRSYTDRLETQLLSLTYFKWNFELQWSCACFQATGTLYWCIWCQFKQMIWRSCNRYAISFVTIHSRSCLTSAVADWSLTGCWCWIWLETDLVLSQLVMWPACMQYVIILSHDIYFDTPGNCAMHATESISIPIYILHLACISSPVWQYSLFHLSPSQHQISPQIFLAYLWLWGAKYCIMYTQDVVQWIISKFPSFGFWLHTAPHKFLCLKSCVCIFFYVMGQGAVGV